MRGSNITSRTTILISGTRHLGVGVPVRDEHDSLSLSGIDLETSKNYKVRHAKIYAKSGDDRGELGNRDVGVGRYQDQHTRCHYHASNSRSDKSQIAPNAECTTCLS